MTYPRGLWCPAPRSMVPNTMVLMLGSIRGLRCFCFFGIRRFLNRSTSSDRLRFELRALTAPGASCAGLIIFLIPAPCRREQGAKRDRIRVGSCPGGIRRGKKGPVLFSRFLMENIPRNFCMHNIENSTEALCGPVLEIAEARLVGISYLKEGSLNAGYKASCLGTPPRWPWGGVIGLVSLA